MSRRAIKDSPNFFPSESLGVKVSKIKDFNDKNIKFEKSCFKFRVAVNSTPQVQMSGVKGSESDHTP